MSYVRKLIPRLDIDWIVEELRDLPNQSEEYSYVADDPQWVGGYFRAMGDALVGAVDAERGSFILGQYGPTWFSAIPNVHELILWVPERYRGDRTALRLIKHFVTVCAETDASKIIAGASLDISNNDKTLRLYEMCGFTRRGTGVEKELHV